MRGYPVQKIEQGSKDDRATATKAAELFNTNRSCFRTASQAYAITSELKRDHGQRGANAGRSCEPDNRPRRGEEICSISTTTELISLSIDLRATNFSRFR